MEGWSQESYIMCVIKLKQQGHRRSTGYTVGLPDDLTHQVHTVGTSRSRYGSPDFYTLSISLVECSERLSQEVSLGLPSVV